MTVKEFYDYIVHGFGTDDVAIRLAVDGYTHSVDEDRLHLGFDVYDDDKETVFIAVTEDCYM